MHDNGCMTETVGATFTQKYRGTKLVFNFREKAVAFTHEDATGRRNVEVPYETIDLPNPYDLLVKGYILRRPELIPLAAAAALMAALRGANTSVILVAAAGFLGAAVYLYFVRRRGVKYTFFTAQNHKIRIMQNNQHDAIVAELKTHWVARLRELFGTVNVLNDPAKELAKFQRLKDLKIISEEEFEQRQAEIHALQVGTPPSESGLNEQIGTDVA